MKKVGMISLGCAKNRVDSENLLGMLAARGFEIVSDPAEADVLFVNTCGFIESAKEDPSTRSSRWPSTRSWVTRSCSSRGAWPSAIRRR